MHPSGYTALSKMPSVKAYLAIYCLVNGVSAWIVYACRSVYVQAKYGISVLVRRWSVFQNTSQTRCLATSKGAAAFQPIDTHPILCGSKNKLCCVSCPDPNSAGLAIRPCTHQFGSGYARLHIASVYNVIKDVKYMEYQYHNIKVKTISQYNVTIATVVNGSWKTWIQRLMVCL